MKEINEINCATKLVREIRVFIENGTVYAEETEARKYKVCDASCEHNVIIVDNEDNSGKQAIQVSNVSWIAALLNTVKKPRRKLVYLVTGVEKVSKEIDKHLGKPFMIGTPENCTAVQYYYEDKKLEEKLR